MKHKNPQNPYSSAYHRSSQYRTADNHKADAVNTKSQRENPGIPTSRIQANTPTHSLERENIKTTSSGSRRLRPIKKFKISRARRTRLTGFFSFFYGDQSQWQSQQLPVRWTEDGMAHHLVRIGGIHTANWRWSWIWDGFGCMIMRILNIEVLEWFQRKMAHVTLQWIKSSARCVPLFVEQLKSPTSRIQGHVNIAIRWRSLSSLKWDCWWKMNFWWNFEKCRLHKTLLQLLTQLTQSPKNFSNFTLTKSSKHLQNITKIALILERSLVVSGFKKVILPWSVFGSNWTQTRAVRIREWWWWWFASQLDSRGWNQTRDQLERVKLTLAVRLGFFCRCSYGDLVRFWVFQT